MLVKEATAVYTGDIWRTLYDCGCEWSSKLYDWVDMCPDHSKQERPVNELHGKCHCLNVGEDDGPHTCWQHHDCFRGDCTHMDNDDFDGPEAEEVDCD